MGLFVTLEPAKKVITQHQFDLVKFGIPVTMQWYKGLAQMKLQILIKKLTFSFTGRLQPMITFSNLGAGRKVTPDITFLRA